MHTEKKPTNAHGLKRFLIGYIIIALILGITSVGVLGFTLRDKISLSWQTTRLMSDFERGTANTSENALIDLTNKHRDIAEIILLDANNQVVVQSGDPIISAEQVVFTTDNDRTRYRTWQIEGISNISFREIHSANWLGVGFPSRMNGHSGR